MPLITKLFASSNQAGIILPSTGHKNIYLTGFFMIRALLRDIEQQQIFHRYTHNLARTLFQCQKNDAFSLRVSAYLISAPH